ncbi:MAG: putative lipopolysaccharide heptosyltransferase III [Betaproteobacteria bacterium]
MKVPPTPLTKASYNDSAPRRVLVIRLQNHGDVLLTTPIFAALKRHFPGVEVDAMVFAETVPMLHANPDLTRVWALPRSRQAGRGLRRIGRLLNLMRGIRSRRYDWVLHLNDQWPGALAAAVSGASLRFSYDMEKRDYWLWRRIFPQRIPATASGHMVEQNLRVLHALGMTVDAADAPCTMAFDDVDAALARQKLDAAGVGEKYIVVHPASRWFFKCWEDDRFAEVIAAVARSGWKIVITAASEAKEMELVASMMRLADHPNVVSLAGQLTLPALAAVISKASLFVGVDSVPMHMAAALDVPIVALFGPTHVHIWRPWSQRAEVIHAADYGPLMAPNDVDTSTTERYLVNIPVQPVLDAVRRQLERYAGTPEGSALAQS